MFESVEGLESDLRDWLADQRFYSRQSWSEPSTTRAGAKVHDIVIVGAGQNGLALAYSLKLRGVRRVVVVDAQEQDKPGPWASFARMPTLRTPKAILGPDCGNPLLHFKTWFCAAYSREEYDSFDFIPLRYWQEYLVWFREVLGIDVVANTLVTGIDWDDAEGCLRLTARGEADLLHARKVCLATGMTAAGRWEPPQDLVAGLPRESYHCAWEPIAWTELSGLRVAVVGAGASGFDNASRAVDAGCRSVTIVNRSRFPEKDLFFELWRGRDDSGLLVDEAGHPPADRLDPLLAHNSALDDEDRLRLLASAFRLGRSPCSPEYLTRVSNLDAMTVLEGWPIERVEHDAADGTVRIHGPEGTLEVDRVIFATGPRMGLRHRPELSSLADRILTWQDVDEAASAAVPELGRYPKLTEHFQLRAKDGGDALRDIYSLADFVHATVGLQSVGHVVVKVAAHVAESLYREQVATHIAAVEGVVKRDDGSLPAPQKVESAVRGVNGGTAGPKSDVWFTWNDMRVEGEVELDPPSGIVFDETLRDGLQAPYVHTPSLEQKLRIVDHMARSGIRSADLGFPGSGPAALAECTRIAQYIADQRYPLAQGYAGRTHPSDINAICEIAQAVGVPVDAYVFIGVSPIRQYVEDWNIGSIVDAIRRSAQDCAREGVEFVLVLEDAVRCTPETLDRVYAAALEVGVRRVTLCDTVGAASPEATVSLLRWSRRYFAERGRRVDLEWHGHNDRGLALVNSMTALGMGCSRVHGTILGIGERAGNTSLDQLMLNSHLDGHVTYDLKSVREYCEYASAAFDVPIPANYPGMGRDVFKTSAGVHASAILKAHEKGNPLIKDTVYSSVPASVLGREQEVLIDAASGANNVRYWLTVHGYEAAHPDVIKNVLDRAKSSKRPLTDELIREILASPK
jgi:2-isopropylmalate synthase